MLFNALIVSLVVICALIYLWLYRTYGLLALYLNGLPLFFLLTDTLKISTSTVITGIYSFATGGLAFGIFFFSRTREHEESVPRHFSIAYLGYLVLFGIWYLNLIIEASMSPALIKHEYYKWAYGLAYWLLPLVLGFVVPCTVERMRKLWKAIAILGLGACAFVFLAYLGGRQTTSSNELRYYATEQLGAGAIGKTAALGAAALLAGYLVGQKQIRSRTIIFLIIGMITFLATTILTGSRSPLIAIIAAILAALLMLRFKYFILSLVGGSFAAIILLFVVLPLLPAAATHRAISWDMIVNGFYNRLYLVKNTLQILNISPVFGRTLNLLTLLGFNYSHNLTLQVLVETGLVGFTIFTASNIYLIVRWWHPVFSKASRWFPLGAPLFVFAVASFVESHSHGSLNDNHYWFVLAFMAGHTLTAQDTVADWEEIEYYENAELLATK